MDVPRVGHPLLFGFSWVLFVRLHHTCKTSSPREIARGLILLSLDLHDSIHSCARRVTIKQEDMTVGFVRASKAYILPTVLGDVYRFRKAFLTIDSVLRSIFSAISTTDGTAEAVSTLRGNHSDGAIDCLGLQPSGYSSGCPWGLLPFIRRAALSLGVDGTLSEAEVR